MEDTVIVSSGRNPLWHFHVSSIFDGDAAAQSAARTRLIRRKRGAASLRPCVFTKRASYRLSHRKTRSPLCCSAASCLNTHPPPPVSAFASLFLLTTAWQWGEMSLKATAELCAGCSVRRERSWLKLMSSLSDKMTSSVMWAQSLVWVR